MAKSSARAGTAIVPASPRPEFGAMEVAKACAASGFFQDSRDAAQAVVKMQAARELGFGAVAGMVGVYVVKGRITLSANLMAATIQKSGKYRYRVRKHTNKGCEIEFQERDPDSKKWEVVGTSGFTEDDAKAAGLSGGDNWRKYPRNMYFARALSNGAKWYCPDVFAGQTPYTPDELDDGAEATEEGEFIVREASPPSPSPGITSSLREEFDELVARGKADVSKIIAHYGKKSADALTDDDLRNANSLLREKYKV